MAQRAWPEFGRVYGCPLHVRQRQRGQGWEGNQEPSEGGKGGEGTPLKAKEADVRERRKSGNCAAVSREIDPVDTDEAEMPKVRDPTCELLE